jgi:hypothetical protein
MHNVQDNVRQKYLELVKKYHPDTADTASVEKFQKIDEVSFTIEWFYFPVQPLAASHNRSISFG